MKGGILGRLCGVLLWGARLLCLPGTVNDDAARAGWAGVRLVEGMWLSLDSSGILHR